MKIPGITTALPSLVKILVITTGLCTASIILYQAGHTLAESTSGRYESLEVSLGELKVKATGRNTTEAVKSLLGMSRSWGGKNLGELY